MFRNNFSGYTLRKEVNKGVSIFRPWDPEVKDNAQDSTVSTTTTDDESIKECKVEEVCLETVKTVCAEEELPCRQKNTAMEKKRCRNLDNQFSIQKLITHPQSSSSSSEYLFSTDSCETKDTILPQINAPPLSYLHDSYTSDMLQINLAQHLGLPPNDQLVLESLSQGYALEEYARVINQEQQAKLMSSKKQRPKKYKCTYCDVGFSNNGQLKGHIRIHTGERPFKCSEKDCGKTFTRNEELTRHKRIHSGLRPFPCSHCGKRFGRKDHLKKHSRTHFQPRGLYAVPVVLPFEAWASGQTNGYPFFPVMY